MRTNLKYVLLLVGLLFFAGCDNFGGKKDDKQSNDELKVGVNMTIEEEGQTNTIDVNKKIEAIEDNMEKAADDIAQELNSVDETEATETTEEAAE